MNSIDFDKTDDVLLADGAWHHVSEFALGSRWLGGANVQTATWKESGSIVMCPVTSILAVRWKEHRGGMTRQERAGAPQRTAKGSLSG